MLDTSKSEKDWITVIQNNTNKPSNLRTGGFLSTDLIKEGIRVAVIFCNKQVTVIIYQWALSNQCDDLNRKTGKGQRHRKKNQKRISIYTKHGIDHKRQKKTRTPFQMVMVL